MIIKDRDWILIIPSVLEEFEKRSPGVAGKWLIFLPREALHLYIDRLDTLVEEAEFTAATISNKMPGMDPFRQDDCVIGVYTSDAKAQIEKTEKKLKRMGLNPYAWKSEEKINKGWFPGGKVKFKAKDGENRPGLRFSDILSGEHNLRDLGGNSPDSGSESVEPSGEANGAEEKGTGISPDIQNAPLRPFQLDWIEPRIIDKNNLPFFMSPKLHQVLREMLSKEPGGGKRIRGFLSDRAVASVYAGIEIEDPEEAKRIAGNFARHLRRKFRECGIEGRDSLIKRCKTLGGYSMGYDWRSVRPLIDQAEVSLFFRDDLDDEPGDPDEE